MGIKLKLSGTENFVRNEEYAKIQPAVKWQVTYFIQVKVQVMITLVG